MLCEILKWLLEQQQNLEEEHLKQRDFHALAIAVANDLFLLV